MENFFHHLLIMALAFGVSIGVETGTDCGGKEFLCQDASHFYACIDFGGGRTRTIVDSPQECPMNTVCNDDLALECAGILDTTTIKIPEVSTIEVILVPGISTDTLPEPFLETEVINDTIIETTMSSTEPETITESPQKPPISTETNEVEITTTEELEITTNDIQETTDNVSEPETTDAISSEPKTTDAIPSEPEITTVIELETSSKPEVPIDSTTSSLVPEITSLAPTPEPFECSISGKFPDLNDCRKFKLCIWTPFGYLKFDQTCPINLAYDIDRHDCTPNQASCNTTGFKCEQIGRFADLENDKDYHLCLENTKFGGFYQYKLSCSVLTIFDPIKQKCVLDLFSSVQTQTQTSPQQTKSDQNNNKNNQSKDGSNEELPFECVTAGTFAHPNDERRFIVCTLKKKDKLKKKVMKCKKTEKFDTDLMLCTDAGISKDDDTDNDNESDEDDD